MDLNRILKSLKVANLDTCFWQYTGNPTTEAEYNSSIIFYDTDNDGNTIEITKQYSWSQIENEKVNIALQILRQKRNQLLAETDWVVLPDSPIADKTAWENYRTQLRDITNGLTTLADVESVVWPERPVV